MYQRNIFRKNDIPNNPTEFQVSKGENKTFKRRIWIEIRMLHKLKKIFKYLTKI